MQLQDVPFEAVNQAGVFTRAQAYSDGWTPRQTRRRLDAGRWKAVAGSALAATATAIGPWQLAYAVLLTWPTAVISHELAGALHGLPVDPAGAGTATVPHAQGLRACGLRVYRSPLAADDIGQVGGLPVTSEARTMLDLLAQLSWDEARSLWSWLVTRRRMDLASLESGLLRRSGLVGTPQLRRLVAVGRTGSLSAAEDRFHELLGRAGIRGWTANVPIQVDGRVIAVVDVLFTSARLVVEIDGYRVHSSRDTFQRDRRRQNQLIAAGYTVLRFTWQDLEQRPRAVVAEVVAALQRAA
jgi:very-short-patch-repair endonuclease